MQQSMEYLFFAMSLKVSFQVPMIQFETFYYTILKVQKTEMVYFAILAPNRYDFCHKIGF